MCKAECVFIFRFAISPPRYPRYLRHRATRGIADTLPVTMTPLKTILGCTKWCLSPNTIYVIGSHRIVSEQ